MDETTGAVPLQDFCWAITASHTDPFQSANVSLLQAKQVKKTPQKMPQHRKQRKVSLPT